jgi:hypothetical protein
MKAELLNISADDYHAGTFCSAPCYSNSIGKVIISQSPKHAWMRHPMLNPNYEGEDESKFAIGSAAHAALLEGMDICTVIDAPDWRTNAAKEARDLAYLSGKIPVLQKQYEAIARMVSSAHVHIQACSELGGIKLSDGKPEQTILLTGQTDLHIKMRLDWLKNDNSLILDYKTTDIANPDAWMRSISQSGYDMQAALYTKGVELLASNRPKFVFAIQEATPPYAMYFVGMSDQYLEYGQQRSTRAISIWRNCIESNRWPAYTDRIMWPELPPWVEGQWIEKEAMQQDARKAGDVPDDVIFG